MQKILSEAISLHIEVNGRIYRLLVPFVLAGIAFGSFCTGFLSDTDVRQLYEYFEDFLRLYQSDMGAVRELFGIIAWDNIKYIVIMMLAGFTVVGMPLIALLLAYKAFGFGFSFGCLLKIYGMDGFVYAMKCVFSHNALTLPLLIVFAAVCIRFSLNLLAMIKGSSYKRQKFEEISVVFIGKTLVFAALLTLLSFLQAIAIPLIF